MFRGKIQKGPEEPEGTRALIHALLSYGQPKQDQKALAASVGRYKPCCEHLTWHRNIENKTHF